MYYFCRVYLNNKKVSFIIYADYEGNDIAEKYTFFSAMIASGKLEGENDFGNSYWMIDLFKINFLLNIIACLREMPARYIN